MAGSYTGFAVQAVVSYPPFTGLMRTGCPQTSDTGMCAKASVPGKGGVRRRGRVKNPEAALASKARSYTGISVVQDKTLEDAFELVGAVVVDGQLALARSLVLDLDARAELLGHPGLEAEDVRIYAPRALFLH